MENINTTEIRCVEETAEVFHGKKEAVESFAMLEKSVFAALETYSNVHRGSGHKSMVSTSLYEQSREIVLEYIGLKSSEYVVVFCTPQRAAALEGLLKPGSFRRVSSRDIGLPLGVTALAIERKAFPGGIPFETGGGTTRLISPDRVIWAKSPERLEAGTPAIINVIAFARALQLIRKSGDDTFRDASSGTKETKEILHANDFGELTGKELLDELRKTCIGDSVRVPTTDGPVRYINLDNAASTPTFFPIWKVVLETWRQPEKVQQEIVCEVKSICAGVLGAPPSTYEVIFTTNTTEAINLAAESLIIGSEPGIEPVVVVTLLEHSSNDLPWRYLAGHSLIRIKADADGFVDPVELDSLMKAYNRDHLHGNKRIRLVTVSGASNVLGTCNDLAAISRVVHDHGALLMVDAAQLVAHRKISMEESDIDLLAFSGHKVYAPFGCGVLVAKKGLLHFNSSRMELIQSSGEENTVGIAALGKSLLLLQRIGMEVIGEEEKILTRHLLNGLSQVSGLILFGIKDPASPAFANKLGVVVFRLKGFMPNRLAKKLALHSGIGIRYGCHCAHLLVKHLLGVGPGLERFQFFLLTVFPAINLPGIARISLGLENRKEDVDTLVRLLGRLTGKQVLSKEGEIPPGKSFGQVMSGKQTEREMKKFARDAGLSVFYPEKRHGQ
jgi:selenocysteine lyase/cysteine desulfurase